MQTHSRTERTLSELDHRRLLRLLASRGLDGEPAGAAIQEVLDTSELLPPPEVPADVVTMYSQVLLENAARRGAPYKLTLCYPDDAEPAQGLVSVLSPVGLSLLGLRAGELAEWRLPGGHPGAARILSVLFQPEASGDYST